jgi:hypothetical protein
VAGENLQGDPLLCLGEIEAGIERLERAQFREAAVLDEHNGTGFVFRSSPERQHGDLQRTLRRFDREGHARPGIPCDGPDRAQQS